MNTATAARIHRTSTPARDAQVGAIVSYEDMANPAAFYTVIGHVTDAWGTEAQLVCLSYLGLGTSPAHVRYVVRRLRRILPEGTAIIICYWSEEDEAPTAKQLLEAAEADAYATSIVNVCFIYRVDRIGFNDFIIKSNS